MKIFLQTVLLSICFFIHAATASELPPEFTATYSAKTYGVTAAQATYKLSHIDNGLIFTQSATPVGVASIFSDDSVDETSILSLHDGQLLLDEYSYIQKGSKKDRNIQISIQWQASEQNVTGNLNGVARGKPIKQEVTGPVWDTLSFQIPMMMAHHKDNDPEQDYVILSSGTPKTYTFVTHGQESIKAGGKNLSAFKIERRSDEKGKAFYFWVAPELHNIPVKIEKWKDGKPHITMLLDEAHFSTATAASSAVDQEPDLK